MPQKSLTMFAFWKKLPYRKKARYEKGKSSSESLGRSQSLVPKQEKHPEPPAQPNDLWMQAQERLEQNSDLAKILGESVKILESDYGLKLQPGDTSHHQRLRDLLEERKWVIHLGQHSVSVGEQISNISKNVLAIKDLVTSAASSSPPASIACAGIITCFSVSANLVLSPLRMMYQDANLNEMVVQAAEQHNFLLQGLETTSGLVLRLHVMENLYSHSQTRHATDMIDDFHNTLVSLYSKILEFQARAVCYVHRHSASQILRNIFKWDGWADLLQDFERLEKSLDRFTFLIGHAELTQKLEEILKTSREHDIWRTTSDRDERVKKFFNLLYTCPYKDRKDRNSKRVPGTCEWFTNHPKFKDWQRNTNDESPGLLWVSADPGCGKSVLTRYLVDELLLNTTERTVCYFFFKDDFSDQRSATSALSVILRQLFIAQPQLLQDAVLDKLETDGDKLVESFSELWSILVSASANSKAGEIICILDALDECQDSDRNPLISHVKDLYLGHHKSSNLKFLITSRPYEHIGRGFRELERNSSIIHLSGESDKEAKDISHEIDLVIEKRVDDISYQRSLEKDERDMLAQQLKAVDNRTYLWVSLTLDVLENIPSFTPGNVRGVMQVLPTDVDSAYEKILNRSSDKDKARVLLHIITAAMRPLSLEELCLALAVSAGPESRTAIRDYVEPKDRFRKTLRDLCGLFVVVIDEKVYLLHQTAKEFLVRGKKSPVNVDISMDTRWKHSILPEKSNYILANICTSYITLVADQMYQGVFEKRSDGGAYLDYSSCYWSVHFRQAYLRDEDPLILRAQRICDPKSDVYQMWSGNWGSNLPNGATTLLIASYLGLADVVNILAKETVDINSRDSDHIGTPIYWATDNGHEAVVKLLLATGQVDINSRYSSSGLTLLSLAAINGNEAVVKLLLATGQIDINSRDLESGTPLSRAAQNGHEAVVKLLLATGEVDINSRDLRGQTPLFLAAQNSHEAVVKLLLATGQMDINSRDLNGQTPLSRAAQNGHEAVVKLLLATGQVDINSRDLDGWTPLSLAAIHGKEAVAELLLATGQMDINSRDLHGHTPLFWAVEQGNERVVKLLLTTGKAFINSRDSDGEELLLWAARNGHETVVKLLLTTGQIDINPRDWIGGETPLFLAAQNGYEAVVKLLLTIEQVDLNFRNSNGQTPLSQAAENGHEEVVKLLLATGKVDIDCRDSYGETPLSLAARYGHEAVVKLLLVTGKVDINNRDRAGQTPLSWAAANGYEEVVKLLLATGKVDIDARDLDGRTPLSWAARTGCEAVVKLLLATGQVDIDSRDLEYGRTPLFWAAANGHEAVVKLLLTTGKVDIDARDLDGQTPLSWAAKDGHEAVVKLLQEFHQLAL